jgi:hypothetical protein
MPNRVAATKKPRTKKIKAKTPSQLKADCWALYSKWIRKKYSDTVGMCSCYTCGTIAPAKDMQSGHGIAGRGNVVLFCDEIVRVQCPACNLWKGGNYQVFVPKLIKEIGMERYEEIERASHLPHKFPKGYLEGKIIELKALLANKLEGEP